MLRLLVTDIEIETKSAFNASQYNRFDRPEEHGVSEHGFRPSLNSDHKQWATIGHSTQFATRATLQPVLTILLLLLVLKKVNEKNFSIFFAIILIHCYCCQRTGRERERERESQTTKKYSIH